MDVATKPASCLHFSDEAHTESSTGIIGLMREQSYGVIPVRRQNEQYLFLLVQHHAGHWAFPKGHANPGESDDQAARRELVEETGISEFQLLPGVSFAERYFFKREGQTVIKTVRYFLGLVNRSDVQIQDAEIKAYQWATYDQALALITFSQGKRLLTEAHDYLTRNRQQVDKLHGLTDAR